MPTHTFTTTGAEKLSTNDSTPYAAICIAWRLGNAASFQFGGEEQPTSNAAGGGGITLGAQTVPYFWIPVIGVKLTELFCAGAIGDVVDIVCFHQKGVSASS